MPGSGLFSSSMNCAVRAIASKSLRVRERKRKLIMCCSCHQLRITQAAWVDRHLLDMELRCRSGIAARIAKPHMRDDRLRSRITSVTTAAPFIDAEKSLALTRPAMLSGVLATMAPATMVHCVAVSSATVRRAEVEANSPA